MMAQKLMSENKDNPFNSRFFQPSDALPPTGQDRRSVQGLGYFLPMNVPKYNDKGESIGNAQFKDARWDLPQVTKDFWSAMQLPGKAYRGELGIPSIDNPSFVEASKDYTLAVGGGSLLSSRVPGFVPEGSLGIFAGKSAKNFPAKSMLKQTKEETLELDKFMEKQDFRPGFENPTGRFEASKRQFGTGLFKLPDGQYRFEIDDTVAKLKNLDDAFINQGQFHEIVANVAGAKNIQLDAAGSLNTFFNSKNAVKLPDIFNHKELFENYPQLKDMKVAFYSDPSSQTYGAFYESANAININVGAYSTSRRGDPININTPENKEKILDILVHEIQHKVQDIENFAPGSNMRESEMRFLNFKNSVESRQDNFRNGYISYETLSKPLSALNDAEYIKKLDEYIAKDTGYQPRQLFNQMDWYKYGNDISSELSRELGYSYPKVKSNKRDVWIKGAYAKMRDKSLDEMRVRQARGEGGNIDYILESSSLKEIKSEIGKVTRTQNKYFKDYLEFKKLNNKLVSLNKFKSEGHSLHQSDAFKKYQIILGEAEARAVQARRGKTITTPNLKNRFSDSETFEKTYFPPDQFNEGKMVNPPSYFNLTLDDLVI